MKHALMSWRQAGELRHTGPDRHASDQVESVDARGVGDLAKLKLR